MQPTPTLTTPTNTPNATTLANLTTLGNELAELILVQARLDAQVQHVHALHDAAIAFDRIARAVRRCILLANHIEKQAPQTPQPAHNPDSERAQARKDLIRKVENAIRRERQGDEAEALEAEFHERLDAPDLDDDIASKPVGVVMDEILADLGLRDANGVAFKRRTPHVAAELAARAAARPQAPDLAPATNIHPLTRPRGSPPHPA